MTPEDVLELFDDELVDELDDVDPGVPEPDEVVLEVLEVLDDVLDELEEDVLEPDGAPPVDVEELPAEVDEDPLPLVAEESVPPPPLQPARAIIKTAKGIPRHFINSLIFSENMACLSIWTNLQYARTRDMYQLTAQGSILSNRTRIACQSKKAAEAALLRKQHANPSTDRMPATWRW